jgi:isoleucyl-tRNA synthetase
MHGFFVDEKGEKMSKSVGNFVPLEQILDKYGADAFRLWGASNTIWDELKFSWDEMKKASADLNIALNMVSFLERFYPQKRIKDAKLTRLDEWMMSRLNSTMREFRDGFAKYELNRSAKALRNLLVEDISRFYMKIAKERIQSGEDADAALYVIYEVMLSSLRMLGCISPMLSEHLYQRFFRKFEAEESLFLLRLEAEDEGCINTLHEKQVETVKGVVSAALLARQSAGMKVRWPIRTLYIETKSLEVKEAVGAFKDIILSMVKVKGLETVDAKPAGELASQEFSGGAVHLDRKMDEELYEEGVMNEVKRRVQMMRKEAELVESDKISLHVSCEKEMESIVRKHGKTLCEAVNAAIVKYDVEKTMNEYEIDGRLLKLAIRKQA